MDDQIVGYFQSSEKRNVGLEAVVEIGGKWKNLRESEEVKSWELTLTGWGK